MPPSLVYQKITTMKTLQIFAEGHDGSLFVFNTKDGTWDFANDVDASHVRYNANEAQLEWAKQQAEGTLLRNITTA